MKIQVHISRVFCTGVFTIITAPNSGKTYLCPAWIEIPKGTKFEDIEVIGIKKPSIHTRKEFPVIGSTGSSYTVTIDNRLGHTCSCVGFMYHRNCSHIKNILKTEYEIVN